MDSIREIGRNIGQSNRNVELMKRRGGALPQVDRTRGFLRTTTAFIAPFVTNELGRRISLSLNFTEGT